jgi:succinyl-diaminopimelate desuccinylase
VLKLPILLGSLEEISMDYVPILKDLISVDTTVPPGNNYAKVISYLQPLFNQAGFETEIINIPPDQAEGREGRVNLICHRREIGKPRLIFYAHIDVVPAHGWNAFKPVVDKEKIFGRGAADMKGAIPALLLALDKTKNTPLRYDTTVMITTDEELSQASQLRYISQFIQPVQGAYFFDLDSNFGYVSIANLGALHLDIRVKGKSVHSGLSHLGENAVEKAVPLMDALLKLKRRVTRRKSKIPTHPETGIKQMVARLNINMVHGGLKVNIVPDECIISVDRRLIPEEKIETARKEIIDTLSAILNVNWEIIGEVSIPAPVPCQDIITDRLVKIIKEVTGKGGKYGEMGSGDLSNIVVNEWGGREFGLGVIRTASNIHGNDEFVYRKDIEDLTEIIYRFLTTG